MVTNSIFDDLSNKRKERIDYIKQSLESGLKGIPVSNGNNGLPEYANSTGSFNKIVTGESLLPPPPPEYKPIDFAILEEYS